MNTYDLWLSQEENPNLFAYSDLALCMGPVNKIILFFTELKCLKCMSEICNFHLGIYCPQTSDILSENQNIELHNKVAFQKYDNISDHFCYLKF